MLRESYILDTLECGEASFATACLLANRKYNKNNHTDDIKSHQYIISFDPRDAVENGLTMEKAQALGLEFCEENFPGHPAIVCTHPDGHNHSGNIHVHIVIGSIRTREVERKPYMQKPRDCREGKKHTSTAQTMRHLRVEVMELCEGAGLYQIDHLARAFYPAILACWNSEEGQREFAAWQTEQAHIATKEKQEVPVGELPALLIVCGFLQGASYSGARPVFVLFLIFQYVAFSYVLQILLYSRSKSVLHTPARSLWPLLFFQVSAIRI